MTAQADGSYVLRLDGIPAHRLGDWFQVSGTADSNSFSMEVCPLSYVRTVLWTSDETSDDNLAKDAMAAFLEYYEAAMEYREAMAS